MSHCFIVIFCLKETATTEINKSCHTLSLADALPIFSEELLLDRFPVDMAKGGLCLPPCVQGREVLGLLKRRARPDAAVCVNDIDASDRRATIGRAHV